MDQVNQAIPLPAAKPDTKLVGVGGWLLLLVVKLLLGGLILIVDGISGTDRVSSILIIGLGVLSGITAILLLTGNRKGVLLAKITLGIEAALYLLELLPPSDNPYKYGEFFVLSIPYIIYLFRSKRVKNTYFAQPSVGAVTAP